MKRLLAVAAVVLATALACGAATGPFPAHTRSSLVWMTESFVEAVSYKNLKSMAKLVHQDWGVMAYGTKVLKADLLNAPATTKKRGSRSKADAQTPKGGSAYADLFFGKDRGGFWRDLDLNNVIFVESSTGDVGTDSKNPRRTVIQAGKSEGYAVVMKGGAKSQRLILRKDGRKWYIYMIEA